MIDLLYYFLVCLGVSLAVLAFLRWRFPQWRKRRTALLAALPVPTLSVAVSIWLFAKVALSSRADCGIDVCGMTAGAGMILLLVASASFGMIWVIGAAMLNMLDRRR